MGRGCALAWSVLCLLGSTLLLMNWCDATQAGSGTVLYYDCDNEGECFTDFERSRAAILDHHMVTWVYDGWKDGFEPGPRPNAEEEWLALHLAASGWNNVYCDQFLGFISAKLHVDEQIAYEELDPPPPNTNIIRFWEFGPPPHEELLTFPGYADILVFTGSPCKITQKHIYFNDVTFCPRTVCIPGFPGGGPCGEDPRYSVHDGAAHEMGHVLGLCHHDDMNEAMGPIYVSEGGDPDCKTSIPGPGDQEGVCNIYGEGRCAPPFVLRPKWNHDAVTVVVKRLSRGELKGPLELWWRGRETEELLCRWSPGEFGDEGDVSVTDRSSREESGNYWLYLTLPEGRFTVDVVGRRSELKTQQEWPQLFVRH